MDGPCSGVRRQALSFSKLSLTDLTIKISRSAREKQVKKAYEAADINTKWEQTAWSKRIMKKLKRQKLTDFDRYKLKVLKQQVSVSLVVVIIHCLYFLLLLSSFTLLLPSAEEKNSERSSHKVEERSTKINIL